MSRSCEEDPAFDYILTLLLDSGAEPLTVLPTHRIVRGLGDDGVERLLAGLDASFEVQRDVERRATCAQRFDAAALLPRRRGPVRAVDARRRRARSSRAGTAFEPDLPAGGEAVRGLDVTLLGVALERLLGIDAEALAAGAVGYTKSAAEAIDAVDAGLDGADAAFLLEPTPVASILAVAADGDVMPQKSTYFYPKALTGLVINPHEW